MTRISATGDKASAAVCRAPDRGFTLMELMVVLVIIVLMTAATPFALSRLLPARRVNLAAEQLIRDIQWLRIQSAAAGAPAHLVLQPNSYRLEIRERSKQIELPRSTTLKLWLGSATTEANRFSVYADGTGSAGRFEIADSGRRAAVEVSMLTGRARRIT